MNRHGIAALIGIALLGLSGVRPTATATLQGNLRMFSERCPSAADIAFVNRDLKLSFESDPTRGTQVCLASEGSANLTLMQSRVYASLLAMRQLSFDKPLPWTKDPLYRWFIKTVNGIRFRDDVEYSSCCDPSGMISVRAVVDGTQPSGVAVGVRDTQRAAEPMLESFLSLLVHEARHRNGFRHTCGTKDTALKQLGAWSAQYYFHMSLSAHSPTRRGRPCCVQQLVFIRFSNCDGGTRSLGSGFDRRRGPCKRVLRSGRWMTAHKPQPTRQQVLELPKHALSLPTFYHKFRARIHGAARLVGTTHGLAHSESVFVPIHESDEPRISASAALASGLWLLELDSQHSYLSGA